MPQHPVSVQMRQGQRIHSPVSLGWKVMSPILTAVSRRSQLANETAALDPKTLRIPTSNFTANQRQRMHPCDMCLSRSDWLACGRNKLNNEAWLPFGDVCILRTEYSLFQRVVEKKGSWKKKIEENQDKWTGTVAGISTCKACQSNPIACYADINIPGDQLRAVADNLHDKYYSPGSYYHGVRSLSPVNI